MLTLTGPPTTQETPTGQQTTVPANGDTAIFSDAALGVNSTVDAATTIDFLTINQSTTTATNKITLGANLTIDSNGTTGSGINYGSTISNAAMFEVDLNGNTLNFSSSSGGGQNHNLYGTYIFDTIGSRISTSRQYGTGGSDTLSFNIGSGANLANVEVTANGTIGNIVPGSPGQNSTRLATVEIASGSQVNISNNATLNMLRQTRSDGGTIWRVNNSGSISIESGSTLGVEFNQLNNSNKIVNIGLTNKSGGVLNHNGVVKIDLHERGTGTIINEGTWNVGMAGIIQGEVDSAGSGDGGTVVMTNAANGLITGASATTSLAYNPQTSATFLNQSLTLTNSGIISAGVGHNGSGTSSVGTMNFTDINIDASTAANSFRFDLASTSSFDLINLNTGTLALDNTLAILDVYFVNGFNPNDGDSFDIINASSITGNFATINLFNGSGAAADSSNWSFNNSNGVLTYAIPEPSSALLVLTSLGFLIGRRRRA